MSDRKLIRQENILIDLHRTMLRIIQRNPKTKIRDLKLHLADTLLGEVANDSKKCPRTAQTVHEAQLIVADALTHSENNC